MPCVHHVQYNASKWKSDRGPAEAGLNSFNILRKVTETAVGLWDLDKASNRKATRIDDQTESAVEPPKKILTRLYRPDFSESVIGTDERKRVDPKHFAPGGKYRAIVKLFLHFQGQEPGSWTIATGWLISPDLVITAGHCAFDWAYNLGHVTSIKAYIGYNGAESVRSRGSNVEFRWGKHIAAPSEWLTGPAQNYDMALIKLSSPFKNVDVLEFRDTPTKTSLGQTMSLGVVGYPADREEGEYMYEHFREESFDIAKTQRMLTYKIDTAGGNSGSPVLVQNRAYSIGIHAYGGAVNKASVLGPNGNVIVDFVRAMQIKITGRDKQIGRVSSRSTGAQTSVKGFQFITVPTAGDDYDAAADLQQESELVARGSLVAQGNGDEEPYRQTPKRGHYDDYTQEPEEFEDWVRTLVEHIGKGQNRQQLLQHVPNMTSDQLLQVIRTLVTFLVNDPRARRGFGRATRQQAESGRGRGLRRLNSLELEEMENLAREYADGQRISRSLQDTDLELWLDFEKKNERRQQEIRKQLKQMYKELDSVHQEYIAERYREWLSPIIDFEEKQFRNKQGKTRPEMLNPSTGNGGQDDDGRDNWNKDHHAHYQPPRDKRNERHRKKWAEDSARRERQRWERNLNDKEREALEGIEKLWPQPRKPESGHRTVLTPPTDTEECSDLEWQPARTRRKSRKSRNIASLDEDALIRVIRAIICRNTDGTAEADHGGRNGYGGGGGGGDNNDDQDNDSDGEDRNGDEDDDDDDSGGHHGGGNDDYPPDAKIYHNPLYRG